MQSGSVSLLSSVCSLSTCKQKRQPSSQITNFNDYEYSHNFNFAHVSSSRILGILLLHLINVSVISKINTINPDVLFLSFCICFLYFVVSFQTLRVKQDELRHTYVWLSPCLHKTVLKCWRRRQLKRKLWLIPAALAVAVGIL